MSVSKRLRYEVLNRDGFTCRYCHATDVPMTVDHVLPVALGGEDKPENLVAACRDCNAGKAASNPDAEVVAAVSDDDLRWGAAMRVAAETQVQAMVDAEVAWRFFRDHWNTWTVAGDPCPMPADAESTIINFVQLGMEELLQDAVRVAMQSQAMYDRKWRYFCGVVWRWYRERQEIAKALIEAEDA